MNTGRLCPVRAAGLMLLAGMMAAATAGHAAEVWESHLFPSGFRVVARAGEEGAEDPAPRKVAGEDPARVEFSVSRMKGDWEYLVGMVFNAQGKNPPRQSVSFGLGIGGSFVGWEEVLPPVTAAAFDQGKPVPARMLLPVPAGQAELLVACVGEDGAVPALGEVALLGRPKPEGAAKKRVLVVTGEDYPGHPWPETSRAFVEVLRADDRMETYVCESPAMAGSSLLPAFDAVVVHFKNYAENIPMGAVEGERLRQYAESGRGVVLTHFACGAFQEWPDFVTTAGRVWNPEMRAHDPHGEFTVRVRDAAHPVVQGMKDFQTTDELYTCLDGTTPIHVLCDAVSKVDGKECPIAFTVDTPGLRVFHCVLGHNGAAYAPPEVGELFRRGTAWACGLTPEK
ncbi:MAG: ThuA domain-containing protein [Candidatus Hydrogenedentes bacterium]|nr:ThuA domain-containing protein [Candidatus Hydrogenedentota bacterium]